MPLKRCSRDGRRGWKWGDAGKCYIGPGARSRALRQGRAIEASKFGKATIAEEQRLDGLRMIALLDRADARMRRRFLQLVDGAATVQSLEAIADLLEAGRIDEALALGDQLGPGFASTWEQVYTEAGLSAAAVIQASRSTVLEFNTLNPRSVANLQLTRGRLIRELTDSQRGATLELLMDAQRRGLAPVEQARALRSSLGLTQHQAQAVTNYRRLLETGSREALDRQLRDRRFDRTIRSAINRGEPLTREQIDRMTDRYRERWLNFRARTVAETESLRAVHAGDEEMWQQAIDVGDVNPDELINQWRTRPDEKRRPSHAAMEGQRRPFKEPFTSGAGAQLRYPGDPSAPARETIKCRCVVARTIAPPGEAGRQALAEQQERVQEDLSLPGGVVPRDATQKYQTEVEDAWNSMPAGSRRLLRESGVTVDVTERVQGAWEAYGGTGRRTGARYLLASRDGRILQQGILMPELEASGFDAKHTLWHEAGHAIDVNIRNPGRNTKWSQGTVMRRALEADEARLSRLTDPKVLRTISGSGLGYFRTSSVSHNLSECFAEAHAVLLGSTHRRARAFRAAFPETLSAVEQLLKKEGLL